jgi:rare lipoprotein A
MTTPPASGGTKQCFARGLLVSGLMTVSGCAMAPIRQPLVSSQPSFQVSGPSVTGYASWYRRSAALNRTCTGQRLNNNALSAASPTLPMGTTVRVTLLRENRSVIVRVNDCMPRGDRVIDLSEEAAKQLGLLNMGIARVRVTPVKMVETP